MCLPKGWVNKYHFDTRRAHIYTSFLALFSFQKQSYFSSDNVCTACSNKTGKCSSVCKVSVSVRLPLAVKWEQNTEVLVHWTVICSQSVTYNHTHSTMTHTCSLIIRWCSATILSPDRWHFSKVITLVLR